MAKKKATRKTQRRARGGAPTEPPLPLSPVEFIDGGLTVAIPGTGETITIIFGEGPQ